MFGILVIVSGFSVQVSAQLSGNPTSHRESLAGAPETLRAGLGFMQLFWSACGVSRRFGIVFFITDIAVFEPATDCLRITAFKANIKAVAQQPHSQRAP